MRNETLIRCHSSKVIKSLSTILFNVMYGMTVAQIQKSAYPYQDKFC